MGTEFDLVASIDVRGGLNSDHSSSAPNGRLQVGAHTADAFDPGAVHGSTAIVGAPMDANPYFAGMPQTAYIANLQNGSAIAGIVPGLSASAMLYGLDVPADAVGAIVFTVLDFPPLHYNTSNATALLFLNLSGSALRNPGMGAGGNGVLNFSSTLKQFGWAKDTRFGGFGSSSLLELPADGVYVTLTAGPLDSLANLSAGATFGGTGVSISNEPIGLNEVVFLLLPPPPCAGDISGDGVVDDSDFALFAVMYDLFDCADGAMPSGCAGDLNGDGFVDDNDFALFARAYDGFFCP